MKTLEIGIVRIVRRFADEIAGRDKGCSILFVMQMTFDIFAALDNRQHFGKRGLFIQNNIFCAFRYVSKESKL